MKVFGLRIRITSHFTRFRLEIFGQQFIIIVIRYFTGVGLENSWTMNLDIAIIILYGIWALKYLVYGFRFRLLFI